MMKSVRSLKFPVVFAASAVIFAMSFVYTDSDVAGGDSTITDSSAPAEDVAALGAEHKAPEEGSFFEINLEMTVCLAALLVLLGFNHCHCKSKPRVKRPDKMGYVEERQEQVADAVRPWKKATAASAKRKLIKPPVVVGVDDRQEEAADFSPPWRTATAASTKHKTVQTGKPDEEDATQIVPPVKITTPASLKQTVNKFGKPPEAADLVREEKIKHYQEKETLRRLLYEHAKALNVDPLEGTLREMENRYGKLLLMTDYSLVISHLGKAGEADKAHSWLRRALEVGHMPNQCTFNSVINAYVKHGDITQALHVASQMKTLGVEFDTITYNTIIEAWARAGDAERCQQWLRRMLDAGVNASVVTFGSVMRACANAGLLTEIEEWYDLSRKLSIALNLICYCSVVNAFARRDDLENATKWLTRCIESGLQPNVRTFAGLLTSVLNKGDFDAAANIIQRMRVCGVQPDSGVFSQCVISAAKAGQRKRAQTWADECAACKLNLTRAAETAMIQARLRVPNFKKERKDRLSEAAPIDKQTDGTNAQCEKNEDPEAEQKRIEEQIKEQRQLREARMACVGNRYQGTIKEFMPNRFGYILCDETFALFKRDVLLRSADNPDLLAKGQRVSFTLRAEPGSNFPRASELEVYRPSS